jgi:membrane fusion protein (multidrug efflux system)
MSRNRTGKARGAIQETPPDADTAAEALNGKGEPLRKKKGRRAPIILGSLILLVLLGVGITFGTFWIIDAITFVSTDDASIDGDHVNVSAKMLGRIQSVTVEEGSEVQAGQLLVVLDDVDLRAQETQAASSLNYARQNLRLAAVNLDKTRDDFQRSSTLFKTGVATKEQYDHAASALDTANAQYSIAQAQVDTANAQLGVIEAQLLNTRITAPISGTIAKKPLMPGELVQPGQTIFSINDLKDIWVTANFEETKISRIKVGAPVRITVDAYSSDLFEGQVLQISAAILPPAFSIGEFTKTTQRVPVKIGFTSLPKDALLLPGMSVEVKVKAQSSGGPSFLRRLRPSR